MVLSLMRKHATSWIIKILIGLIAVVFVFYFGYSFRGGPNPKVAIVNGEPITEKEYYSTYQQLLDLYRKQYGDKWNESLAKGLNLREKALDILIKRELIRQKTRELGIEVTKEEIQGSIAKYPLFQTDGKFDMGKYRRFLDAMRYTPADFEREVENQIIEQKLSSFFIPFMLTTENEFKEMYNYFYEQVIFNFLVFEDSKYKEKISVSDEEIKSYFEGNKQKYIVPEKIKLSYVVFDPKTYEKGILVEDEQIKDYYESNLEKFHEPEQVKARHILLKLDDPQKEEEIKKKAMDLYKKLKDGEDFSKLASKHSQDPGSKEKGGDLGYFTRGKMVKEFEEAAFTMKPGEISEPIKTQFGYHIIKVEEKKGESTKSLEEVKEEIFKTIKSQMAADKAYEEALKFLEGYLGGEDFKAYGEKRGKKVFVKEPFSREDKPPIQGMEERLMETLFSLGPNEASDILNIGGRYYVFHLDERLTAHQAELDQARDRVIEDIKREKAKAKALEDANRALELLKGGKSIQEISKLYGLEIKNSGPVRRNQPVEYLGYLPDLMEEAFRLGKDNPYPQKVLETPKGFVILNFEEKKAPDLTNLEEEKKRLKLLLGKQDQEWMMANWLEGQKKKAKIEIVKETL